MADKVDKLAAKYAMSVSNAQDMVSGWLTGRIDEYKQQDHGQSANLQSLKPLPNATQGLGAKQQQQQQQQKASQVTATTHSSKALDALKKKHQKEQAVTRRHTEKHHRDKNKSHSSDESDEEENRTRSISKRQKSTSFLDSYKASKKRKK